ncbi:MAG TPA: hypothetical protein VN579_04475 [Bryobacteraceae bacterium]|nr:hypothetical protein [Bryobacteraceae bacterium]
MAGIELGGPKGLIAQWRASPVQMVKQLFKVEPDDWQAEVLEAFPHKQRLAMKANKGPGKLHPKSLVIETPSGPRKWGDILEGDFLFAEDGTLTRVSKRHENGRKKIYRVWFDDGSSTRAGADHLWKVRGAAERQRISFKIEGKENWVVLTTDQIIKRGIRVKNGRWSGRQFEIPRHGPAAFPAARQALDPYLAGVWIGDGHKNEPRYTKPYLEVEEEISRRGYNTRRGKDGKLVTISGAIDEFRALECFKCGSPDRFIPNNYKYASIEQRKDLLCGLMDTDGCIGEESHMEYDTTSERLANDVVWLVRSLGGCAFIKEAIKEGWYRNEDGILVECRDCFRVTVRTPFNPFRIPHKADRWMDPGRNRSTERYLKRYIDRIEPDGYEDSMCIEIDHPSKCYLANDFIVTHNTTVLAWIAWNFLLTRPNPNIAATSISGDNLRDGLWKEMSKWQGVAPLLQEAFEWTSERIFSKQKPADWWMARRTWPKSGNAAAQADTLAGLHQDYAMFILDEAGGIPDAVMASAEAVLAGGIETHIVLAGNPTHLSGPLYRACTAEKHLWHVVQITGDPDDPKRAKRVPIEWARQQIEKYGADNPWVRVNVFGQFPQTSLNALIGDDEVRAAQKRYYRPFEIGPQPIVMGVDVARQGDDMSVIARRQGPQMFNLNRYRNVENGLVGASIVNRMWNEFNVDAAFVDATGGLGFTWIDQLSVLGKTAIPVQFAANAAAADRYANKRAEMYFRLVDWIKAGGALPPEDTEGGKQLREALINTTYSFKGDRMILEDKDAIKAKIGFSPDECDACFVEGTMVATPNGAAPIQTLHVGDEVLTPFGVSKIKRTSVWESPTITTARFSNGSTLRGTPDHEIFAYSHGKVRLDAATMTMVFSPLEERSAWQRMSALFSGAQSIGFKKAAGILAPERQSSVSAFCIAAHGLRLMGQFQRVWSSIIATMIGATMPWTTWRPSHLASTRPITWPSISSGPESEKRTALILREFSLSPQNGTPLQRGSSGIGSMAKKPSSPENRASMNVPSAARNSKAQCSAKHHLASVPMRAFSQWLSGVTSRTLGIALGAVKVLLRTGIAPRSVALAHVATESVAPTNVYNLTLERDNAYYANGILVFNCALTFAEPVSKKASTGPNRVRSATDGGYSPFSDLDRISGQTPRGAFTPYSPFQN